MMVFGTRPEIIKLSPIISALVPNQSVELSCVFTGQQENLAPEFLLEFGIQVSKRLTVMQSGQGLSSLLAKLITELDNYIEEVTPDAIVVQGDTTSALAGALVGNLRHIPVLHVEAGLRTNDPASPFPEETNRKLIAQLAMRHFAATEGNRQNLLQEGIESDSIVVTGNPIVDIVEQTIQNRTRSPKIESLFKSIQTSKLMLVTAHRRENFDSLMSEYFNVLRNFIDSNPDYTMLLPLHPNPVAREIVTRYFEDHERIVMSEPFGYKDFLTLLSKSELIVSDSGGIQEEVASLNRPLIILRETTERPEAIECGIAELAPNAPALQAILHTFVSTQQTKDQNQAITNPFGTGDAGPLIANEITRFVDKRTISVELPA